jgi:hypothetical protein
MKSEIKQIIIYGAFGLLLGAKLIDVLFNGGGLLDWWLLLMGLAAAIIHYLPASKDEKKQEQDGQTTGRNDDNETLVLRDHPDPERSGQLAYRSERPAERSPRR